MDKGEGGVKNGTFVRTSFMDGPSWILQSAEYELLKEYFYYNYYFIIL